MNYQHGGDIYGETEIKLDFSVNTNPLGMPEEVRTAVLQSADSWERYPDCFCRRLRNLLAEYDWKQSGGRNTETKLSAEDFLCGNGASDLLYSMIYALRPKRVLIPVPAFLEYESAVRAGGGEVVRFHLDGQTNFSLTAEQERLFDMLRNGPLIDMVIVGNPNNPNGTAVSAEWMGQLADCCRERGTILVVDECFNWFLKDRQSYSMMGLIRSELVRYDHVVIINAFTKIYSMAGLRLGYLVCRNRTMMAAIEAGRQPWSVSAPAEAAGLAAISQASFIAETVSFVDAQRNRLSAGLEELGFFVYPSMTNYLLFRADDGIDYASYCRRHGILIRSCSNFAGLDESFCRVAVKTREENQALLVCLKAAGREG